MNANHRVNVRMLLGKIDSAPAALDGSTNCNDPRDTGFGRATKHIVQIAGEIRIIKMGVRFD